MTVAAAPLVEKVARAICSASGADPSIPIYRNGDTASGVLYYKWTLFRKEAEAALAACEVEEMRDLLTRIASYPDANPISDAHYVVRKEARDILDRIEGRRTEWTGPKDDLSKGDREARLFGDFPPPIRTNIQCVACDENHMQPTGNQDFKGRLEVKCNRCGSKRKVDHAPV